MSGSPEPATPPKSPEGVGQRAYATYTVLMVAGAALGLVKGLVYAKVLDPTGFGYYGLVIIVMQFGLFLSNWGILSALNNHLPIAYGKGRADDRELLDRALGALFVSSGITSAFYLLIVAVLDFGGGDAELALALAAVTTIGSTVAEFHILVMRVQQGVVRMALTYFLRASLTIVAGAAAGILYGWEGVVVAEFCALIVTLLIARRAWLDPISIRRPNWSATKSLIRAGAPLMVSNVIVTLAFAADRLFVAAALPDDFGQYAFAAIVVVAWIALMAMLEQAVAPRLLREYGAGMKLREVRRQAARVTAAIAAAGLAGLGVLLLLIGPLEEGFLAEYEAGLETMPVLWLGGILLLLTFPGFVLHAIRPSLSATASAIAATITVGGGFLVLLAGDPQLLDFAWLFVAGQAAALITITIAVEVEVRRDTPSPHVLADH